MHQLRLSIELSESLGLDVALLYFLILEEANAPSGSHQYSEGVPSRQRYFICHQGEYAQMVQSLCRQAMRLDVAAERATKAIKMLLEAQLLVCDQGSWMLDGFFAVGTAGKEGQSTDDPADSGVAQSSHSLAQLMAMTTDWMPGASTIQMLGQHGIAQRFWRDVCFRFKAYYFKAGKRRTEAAWESLFVQWVMKDWDAKHRQGQLHAAGDAEYRESEHESFRQQSAGPGGRNQSVADLVAGFMKKV